MRNLFVFVLLLFAPGLISAQDCNDQTLMSMKGSWKKREDANLRPDKNRSQLFSRLDTISKMFQSAYPDMKGMEAGWYRTMANPVIPGGPTAYDYNSLYFSWYCNQNLHKIMLGSETGTWAYVFVNSFSWFISNQYDLLQIKVNNESVYSLPPKKGVWKGHDLYEASAHGPEGRCIILTHGSQFPWKPITQEQYLQSLRASREEQKQATIKGFAKQEEDTKATIAKTQKNNSLKPADREALVASLQKHLEQIQKTKDPDIVKLNKLYDEKFRIIDNYLTHTDTNILKQPAVINPNARDGFDGSFLPEEKGGQVLVTINYSYFNKQIPAYIPQMIVLYWRWENKMASLYFKKQFEENFPVEKLNDMLDVPVGGPVSVQHLNKNQKNYHEKNILF